MFEYRLPDDNDNDRLRGWVWLPLGLWFEVRVDIFEVCSKGFLPLKSILPLTIQPLRANNKPFSTYAANDSEQISIYVVNSPIQLSTIILPLTMVEPFRVIVIPQGLSGKRRKSLP